MTIDEAIKYLAKEPGYVQGLGMQKRIDALKLGIEALKKWQTLREGRLGIIDPLLPGETK